MLRFEILLPLVLTTTVQLGGSIPVLRSSVVKEMGPFGPSLPPDTVHVPFSGLGPGFSLAIDKFDALFLSEDECKANASLRGAHVWSYSSVAKKCFLATLLHPVCSSYQTNEQGYILQEYLSDGSPNDYAVLEPTRLDDLLQDQTKISFRVENPTILQTEGFTKSIGNPWSWQESQGKIILFPNDGSVLSVDQTIIVDPTCYSNSSCGIPFMSASPVASLPYYALLESCSQTISIRDRYGVNIGSHAGIGCRPFPATTSIDAFCSVVVTSRNQIVISLNMVDFQRETCDGFALRVVIFHSNNTKTVYHPCTDNGLTNFIATGGKMKVDFTGGPASDNFDRYGFIINVMDRTLFGTFLSI